MATSGLAGRVEGLEHALGGRDRRRLFMLMTDYGTPDPPQHAVEALEKAMVERDPVRQVFFISWDGKNLTES